MVRWVTDSGSYTSFNGLFHKIINTLLLVLVQFYDLCELFRTGGPVPDTNYIFMVRNGWLSLCVCLQLQVNSPVSQTHSAGPERSREPGPCSEGFRPVWTNTRLVCLVLSQLCVCFCCCRGTLWTGATIVWRRSRTCWLLKPSGPIGSRCSEGTTRADR